jgi:beta-aspartyl-dipeptidase (metallo-type)
MTWLLVDGAESGSILIAAGVIAAVGEVDRRGLDILRVEYDRLDASGCVVWPGLIDVHEHLIGGSGEHGGFATQTPEIAFSELVRAGITTVVGCLGTDTITKTMPSLLAKAKGLRQEGLSAYVWTGGYDVPPVTLTGSVRRDILLIEEVIGAGETAIADYRSTAPTTSELARLVKDAQVGGMLTGKCGVTHFHVGEEPRRLRDLRTLLDEEAIQPDWIYPTHVERNEDLMREAVSLTRRGVTVDIDVVERDLGRWLKFFLAEGGDPAFLTASSDAAITSPGTLTSQIRSCILEEGLPMDIVKALVTTNPARILRLTSKARIEPGADADLVLLDAQTLEVRHVIAKGRRLLSDGQLLVHEAYLKESNRRLELLGERHGGA